MPFGRIRFLDFNEVLLCLASTFLFPFVRCEYSDSLNKCHFYNTAIASVIRLSVRPASDACLCRKSLVWFRYSLFCLKALPFFPIVSKSFHSVSICFTSWLVVQPCFTSRASFWVFNACCPFVITFVAFHFNSPYYYYY